MSFNTALSGGQLTKIRSANYAGDLQLTLCSNTVVFAGQVNSDLTTPTSWASFSYNNVTVGAYTDVEVDEVILIGTVNDIKKATYRGRIRKAPTSSIIYVSESSVDFVAGAYFWVIYTFDPTYVLSRPSTTDPTTAVELVNYEESYAPPRACSVGLRTAYVNRVDPSTNKMRVAFDVSSSFAVASGDSISSYLFTFKASTYTVISGSLSTAIVTVDFNADTEQWGKLTITTANGQVKTRRFYVRAYGTNSQPNTGADETSLQIAGDLSRGWTLSASYFTGIDSVLNRTFGVAWRETENYGGVAGGLDAANNIAFVGWFQREDDELTSDPTFSVLSSAKFEFTGVGPRMQKLRAQEVAIRISSAPSQWGDIANLTPWRAIAHFLDRYSTITGLCDLNFSDKTAAYLFPDFGTQGGNLYSAVQSIAQQIAANIEFAPDGRIEVNISAEYLTNLGRAGLVTVMDLQAQDCFNIQRSVDPDPQVGVVDGVGASYNSASGQVSTYAALAPGHAQGESAGSDTLQGPVLVATPYASAALIDLTQRAGNRYEVANNSEVLDIDHPDGFTFGIPSRFQLYTLTIDTTVAGPNGVSRIIYDTTIQWLLEAVSYSRPGNGATNVHHRYRRLTRIGDPGDNVTQVAANQLNDQLPDLGFPAFNFDLPELTFPDVGVDAANPASLQPPKGMIATTNGDNVLAAMAANIFWLRNFIILKKPRATDITPGDLGSFLVKAVLLSPFFTKLSVPGFSLASDGTNSAVWTNVNVAAPTALEAWVKGAVLSGVYSVLRATNIVNGVYVYSPNGTSTTTTYTDPLTTALGPSTHEVSASYPFGTWSANGPAGAYSSTGGRTGGGSLQGQDTGVNSNGEKWEASAVVDLLSAKTIQSASMWSREVGAEGFPHTSKIDLYNASGVFISNYAIAFSPTGTSQTWVQLSGSGSVANVRYVVFYADANNPGPGPGEGAVPYVDDISVTYADSQTGALAQFSFDGGLTWGAQSVGTALAGAVGGFDVQRSGGVSYGAASGKVRRATTLGGAYADFYSVPSAADAVCIIIPYYRRNSTTRNTSVTNPDVLVATTNGKLYWIDGTSATATDITPSGVTAFDNANCVTVAYGHHLAVFGKVGGTYHLFTSTNGGTTWVDRGTLTSPTFLRDRRNDNRASASASNKGQLYLASDSDMAYSSTWASGGGSDAGLFPRTLPASPVVGFDPLW